MTIPNNKFIGQLHPRQIGVLRAFDSMEKRRFDLEWHRKSRKTTLAINLLIRECCKNPSTVYSYVGPTYRQARAIVWDDPNMLDAYLPDKSEMGWEKNEQKLHVKFENGSLLRILGSDDIDSLRGPDNEGVVFDEWQLIDPAAWTAVFLPMINLRKERWAMVLWTPCGLNHATEEQAIRKTKPNEWYVETLIASKSGLLTQEQLDHARSEMPQTLYDQEYECSHVTNEEMTLITSKMLDDLISYPEREITPLRRIVAIDPALGGDKCPIRYFENTAIKDRKDLYTRDAKVVVAEALIMSGIRCCDNFVVDSIGIGGEICSGLEQAGKSVQRFNSSELAVDNKRFANKKAEMWWYIAEQVLSHHVAHPTEDSELLRQIPVASQYVVVSSGGKIRMKLKSDVKLQLGCSPDDADCWAYGIYGLQNIEPDSLGGERYSKRKSNRPQSAMVC